jgi:hypothetical protein
MKLYSYCLRYDGGAAPNPFWGICTLVICKPAIRRTAVIGDWIVGLGSANSPIGDISRHVVYAMKVTDKLTLKEYDQFCRISLPNKIPQWRSPDYRQRMGDCIYDYGLGEYPKIRWGVHSENERRRDLSGKYALLSKRFYYFGDQPVSFPKYLYPLIHTSQGHKSNQNQPYVQSFVGWIESLGYRRNTVYGIPQYEAKRLKDLDIQDTCSPHRAQRKKNKRLSKAC